VVADIVELFLDVRVALEADADLDLVICHFLSFLGLRRHHDVAVKLAMPAG
jgi:hypothetical protein